MRIQPFLRTTRHGAFRLTLCGFAEGNTAARKRHRNVGPAAGDAAPPIATGRKFSKRPLPAVVRRLRLFALGRDATMERCGTPAAQPTKQRGSATRLSARRRETPRRRLRLGASSAKGRCRRSFAGCGFLHWDVTPQWSDAERLRRSQQSAATRHRLLMRRSAPQPAARQRHRIAAFVAAARLCAHWRRSAPQPSAR